MNTKVRSMELTKALRDAGVRISAPVRPAFAGNGRFRAKRTFIKAPRDCRTSIDFGEAVKSALEGVGFSVKVVNWHTRSVELPLESFFSVVFEAKRKKGGRA